MPVVSGRSAEKLLDLLMAASEASDDDDEAPKTKHISIEGQKDILTEIAAQGVPKFKVGQFVRRSRIGKNRVKFPGAGQTAVIASVFPSPLIDRDGNRVAHGEMAVVQGRKGIIMFYLSDFRDLELDPEYNDIAEKANGHAEHI